MGLIQSINKEKYDILFGVKLTKKQIQSFQKEILEWFGKNKRDLPWRRPSLKLRNGLRDPYNILVSEVMLQQTQVPRVIPKFEAWMKQFPTIGHLAHASTRDVLAAWSGLGYNRRALYLKKLAEEVVKNHNGMFSQDEKELIMLPGIGKYTARAILCFAFDKQIAVVDTNIRKVILTQFKEKMLKQVQYDKLIQEIADQLLPVGKAYEWNQALMDYASANLKHEKIPIPKQSHFKTSNRFYRGQVMKLLLGKDKQTASSLFEKLENNGITKEKFEEILQDMEKDGLICKQGSYVLLP